MARVLGPETCMHKINMEFWAPLPVSAWLSPISAIWGVNKQIEGLCHPWTKNANGQNKISSGVKHIPDKIKLNDTMTDGPTVPKYLSKHITKKKALQMKCSMKRCSVKIVNKKKMLYLSLRNINQNKYERLLDDY